MYLYVFGQFHEIYVLITYVQINSLNIPMQLRSEASIGNDKQKKMSVK